MRQAGVDPTSVPDFVGRHPAWAAALLATLRLGRAQEQTVAALSDRVAQDPVLSDALHRVIPHVTAFRSTAEIIEAGDALPTEMRARFDAIIGEESGKLAEAAQGIVRYFDASEPGSTSGIPSEVVDDNFIANANHFPALERAGHITRWVADGKSVLDVANEWQPDVLVLDLMLPSLSGFEVLKAVRSDPAIAGLPVLMRTAKGQEKDRRLAEDLGANAFVTKPFSNTDVLSRVAALATG